MGEVKPHYSNGRKPAESIDNLNSFLRMNGLF